VRAGQAIAELVPTKEVSHPRIALAKEFAPLDRAQRERLAEALDHWLEGVLALLEPLRKIEAACRDPEAGSEARALLLHLVAGAGMVAREQAGLAHVPKEKRPFLRKLGITIGALDVFAPALLKPAPRRLLKAIGADRLALSENMAAVIDGGKQLPSGYRRAGKQAIRLDMAEKLFRAAHESRVAASAKRFRVDRSLGTSMGLTEESFALLLRDAGFRHTPPRALAEGAFGPPGPVLWDWRAPRKDAPGEDRPRQSRRQGDKRKKNANRPVPALKPAPEPTPGNAFAALAGLIGR
jgi:ATP-dependent RNA helicase SUPV3L1/SUV3